MPLQRLRTVELDLALDADEGGGGLVLVEPDGLDRAALADHLGGIGDVEMGDVEAALAQQQRGRGRAAALLERDVEAGFLVVALVLRDQEGRVIGQPCPVEQRP